MFDDDKQDLDHILEEAEFDVEVEELMEDDGSQEQTGVEKAPTRNAYSLGGLATQEGRGGELRGGGPSWRLLYLILLHK